MLNHGAHIVTDGLVLCLDAANPKSYPGSGTTWKDLSGNGNDGTLVNGVGYSSDNLGSMVFDGVNDNVRIIDEAWPTTGNDLTVLAWVYRDGSSQNGSDYQSILNSSNDSGTFDFSFYVNDGILSGWVYRSDGNGSSTWSSEAQINLNQWYFVGFTVENGSTSTIEGYVDGNLESTTTVSGTRFMNSSIKTIGTYVDRTRYEWNGKVSTVKVYNRALTEAEIKQNFNALRGRYGI